MRRLLFLVALLPACIEQAPLASKGEPRRAAAPSTPAPAPLPSSEPVAAPAAPVVAPAPAASSAPVPGLPEGAQKGGAIFGGAVEILGSKLDPPSASPGQQVAVTVWLKVLAAVPQDEMMFVHVDDADGRPERINGDHWPAGHRVPMNQWKPGEVIVDKFDFNLGGFGESRSAILWVGFYSPDRDERLSITNATQVKTDGNNRFAMAELPILH